MNHPGQVLIFSASGRLPTDLVDAIDGRLTKHVLSDPVMWHHTDFYITRARLSVPVERAAARMKAMPVVWPEGRNFLITRIDARCFSGTDIWLYLPGQSGDAI